MARRTFPTDTPLQALLVEQALLLDQQLEQAVRRPALRHGGIPSDL